jgi:small subunit ribosomal protein S17
MSIQQYRGRELQGVVVGVAMEKTAKVRVERRVKHEVYSKVVTRATNYLVHDENNVCKVGDVVTIKEGKPISKRKSWVLVNILESTS